MKRHLFFAASAATAVFLRPATSIACGGCFHPPDPPPQPMMPNDTPSVVTDHRMVFSVSQTQTILWDQVRYQGNPKEFAWVLPVHAGAKLELSHDAWLAALDAATRPMVQSPSITCPPPPSNATGYSGGGGGGGCGFGSTKSFGFSFDAAYDPGSDDGGSDLVYMDGNGVMVLEQSVVGPYAVVTLRASNGDALGPWLRSNGFDVPPNVDPIVKAYDAEGFDFIAMRLKPGANVQAMQPVRVITQGADLTLPLRMVTAGVGANVGLALWVISEGRYEIDNFPNATITDAEISWFGYQSRSNYAELAVQKMAAGGGKTWLTECVTSGAGNAYQPAVEPAYLSVCNGQPSKKVFVPCPGDGGSAPDAGDAGDPDASNSDASTEAGTDAGTPDGGGCYKTVSGCDDFDDWDVATAGLSMPDITITRLRSVLPASALAVDLKLRASADQAKQNDIFTTSSYADGFDPCPKYTTPPSSSASGGGCHCDTTRGKTSASSITIGAIVALALTRILSRRRAKRER
jgi:hypothetical protein